jgi:NAD(P)H-hydrate epimerase
VVADITVTMIALKPGLLADDGRDVCGSIVVAPLAEQTDRLVVEAEPVAWRPDLDDYLSMIEPTPSSVDKFSRGSVLVVGGSSRYPGAIAMAAKAAARAGAGYVTLAVPAQVAPIVQAQLMEIPVVALPCDEDGCFSNRARDMVVALAEKRAATLVGPGMRVNGSTVSVVSGLLELDRPLVIDADGLNCLARLTSNQLDEFPELLRRDSPLVLTPHRGELGRLVGLADTPPDSLTAALDAARTIVWADGGSELCVVAKGSGTACVSTETALLPKPGPIALATAGSGDVLGGIIAGMLARSSAENDALPLLCALACEAHDQAAAIAAERYGSRGVMAGDIIDAIGLAIDDLERQVAFDDDEETDV